MNVGTVVRLLALLASTRGPGLGRPGCSLESTILSHKSRIRRSLCILLHGRQRFLQASTLEAHAASTTKQSIRRKEVGGETMSFCHCIAMATHTVDATCYLSIYWKLFSAKRLLEVWSCKRRLFGLRTHQFLLYALRSDATRISLGPIIFARL